jgi:hypothetical protein
MGSPNKQHVMRQGEVLRILLPGRTVTVEIDTTLSRAHGAPRIRVDVQSDAERYGPADDGHAYVVENGDRGPGVVFLTAQLPFGMCDDGCGKHIDHKVNGDPDCGPR